jgi:hypothetical protein
LEYHEAKAAFFGGAIADPETIARRMMAHEANRRIAAGRAADDRAESEKAHKLAITEIDSHGIKYEHGTIIIPKNTKVKAADFAEWLYSHGH